MSGPLAGVRVLDFSAMLSGPWAADILGDQGADVIKVEPPGSGDHVRGMHNQRGGMSAWFANINRSKRSICLDLKSAKGLEIARRLASGADVAVQNFRPGVAARLGIDYDSLRAVNHRLVYLSISGYGSVGPYRDRRAYDPLVQALSGLTTIQAGSDSERPRLIRTVLTDKLTSVASAQAICAALVSRDRTGEGQHIELSMLDTVLSFLWASDMNAYTFADQEVAPAESATGIDLIYETADGYIAVSTMTDAEWGDFCRAVERPDLLADERFATPVGRGEHVGDRLSAMQDALRSRTSSAWLEVFDRFDVPCAPVLTRGAVLDDPHIRASGSIQTYRHPELGALRQAVCPPRFSGTPVTPPMGAPQLGQHTREILAEINIADDEVDQLMSENVVYGAPTDGQGSVAAEQAAPRDERTVKVVIGADRGIGLALAVHLHGSGDRVIAACLGEGAAALAAGLDVEPGVDVTSDEAVAAFVKRLQVRRVRISWLVHVSGVMRLDQLDTVDYDDVRRQFEVNSIGPLRTIRELRPFLAPGAKIGVLTSRVGSLGDNTSGGDFAYRISKAAANMVVLNLHHALAADGIAVQALHPGIVATELLNAVGPEQLPQYLQVARSPETAAEQLAAVLDSLTVETAGRFQHADGSYLPW